MRFVAERISARHRSARAKFSCGVESLDRYLHTSASQDDERGVAACWLMVSQDQESAADDNPVIAGYYTLSTDSVERTHLPEELARKLPRYRSMPAVLIGRLALSCAFQGQGLGGELLLDALRRCLTISATAAVLVVLVDPLDQGAAAFYEHYGFQRLRDRPDTMFMPMTSVRRLFAD